MSDDELTMVEDGTEDVPEVEAEAPEQAEGEIPEPLRGKSLGEILASYRALEDELGRQSSEAERLRAHLQQAPPSDDQVRQAQYDRCYPYANQYYQEYLELGFEDERAQRMAWNRSLTEDYRLQDVELRAEERVMQRLAPQVAGSYVPELVAAARQAVPGVPMEQFTEMINRTPAFVFTETPPEVLRQNAVNMAKILAYDAMVGGGGATAPALEAPAVLSGNSASTPAGRRDAPAEEAAKKFARAFGVGLDYARQVIAENGGKL